MTQASNVGILTPKINSSGQLDATTGLTGATPIANGGTNNASLAVTAGGVLYTDGSKVVNVGAGTSGQVLQSNGASAPTWGTASGGNLQQAVYTSGTSTWTCPAGVTKVKIYIAGGGGGYSSYGCGNDGGVGGAGWNIFTVTPGTGYTVTVGAGGNYGSSGVSGGTSSFGALISATGGGGASSSGPGTTGSCANSFAYTGNTISMLTPIFSNLTSTINQNNIAGQAYAYTNTSTAAPGAKGVGYPSGGVGGIVIIQYVG